MLTTRRFACCGNKDDERLGRQVPDVFPHGARGRPNSVVAPSRLYIASDIVRSQTIIVGIRCHNRSNERAANAAA